MTNPTARSLIEAQRCDNCAHWGKADRWDAIAADMGICTAITAGWQIADDVSRNIEYTHDLPEKEDWSGADIHPEDRYMQARAGSLRDAKAVVWDGSEYHAELTTTADFFCAKFAVRAANVAS